MTSTEEIRAVVEQVEPRARVASAIANVCGIMTPDYLPMIELANLIKSHPANAAVAAKMVASQLSFATAMNQARLLSQILAVLKDFDLGTPEREEQVAALRVYHDTMMDELRPGSAEGEQP